MHIITSDGARICDSVIGIVVEKWVYGKFFFSISVKFGETLQKCWLENEKKPKYPNTQICH